MVKQHWHAFVKPCALAQGRQVTGGPERSMSPKRPFMHFKQPRKAERMASKCAPKEHRFLCIREYTAYRLNPFRHGVLEHPIERKCYSILTGVDLGPAHAVRELGNSEFAMLLSVNLIYDVRRNLTNSEVQLIGTRETDLLNCIDFVKCAVVPPSSRTPLSKSTKADFLRRTTC